MIPLTREQVKVMCGCPRCGALAGEDCFQKRGKGKRRKPVHQQRLQKAQEMAGHNVKSKRASAHTSKPIKSGSRKQKSDTFYASWEWKQVRYEALVMHGRQCMVCGFTPTPGCKERLVVDHIKPRSKFPDLALSLSNLQILCNSCNMGKSNIHQHDFRAEWHGEDEEDTDPLTAQFMATMQ